MIPPSYLTPRPEKPRGEKYTLCIMWGTPCMSPPICGSSGVGETKRGTIQGLNTTTNPQERTPFLLSLTKTHFSFHGPFTDESFEAILTQKVQCNSQAGADIGHVFPPQIFPPGVCSLKMARARKQHVFWGSIAKKKPARFFEQKQNILRGSHSFWENEVNKKTDAESWVVIEIKTVYITLKTETGILPTNHNYSVSGGFFIPPFVAGSAFSKCIWWNVGRGFVFVIAWGWKINVAAIIHCLGCVENQQ